MSKPKLSPRERTVLKHFDGEYTELIERLQALEDVVSEVTDVLYLDTVIGQDKETIDKRVDKLEAELFDTVKELRNYKSKQVKKKTSKRLIIK